MAQIIQGPVTVIRVDELNDFVGDIRTKKILTDLLSDDESGKILFTDFEASLVHNNFLTLQG